MTRWMRFLVLLMPLALVLTVAAACEEESPPASSPAKGGPGPRVSFQDESVDFGQVPLDKEVRHVFAFKNVGDDTLKVQDVRVRVVEGC